MATLLELMLNADVMDAWNKCATIPGYHSAEWRRDTLGWAIRFTDYGKTSDYGWELDHRWPTSAGGLDVATNRQAMHWQNNRAKSDNWFV